MALVFCDGFDWYASADLGLRWTGVAPSSAPTTSPIAARLPSGQGLINNGGQIPGSAWILYKSLPSNYASGLIGVAFRHTDSVANKRIIAAKDAFNSEQLSLRTNGSAVLIVSRNGTTIATGSTALSANTWYYAELKFTINDSTGVIEVKLNGATEIASTGSLDTKASVNAYFNMIGIIRTSDGGVAHYDDIYVLDTTTGANTDFLGPVQVVARYPDGNGNYAQWTPNGGSNMGCISEAFEDGNASFNQSSTANQIDTFSMQNLPAAAGSVYAVAQHTVAAQDGGGARTIRPKLRIGGSDYNGSNVNTGATYQFFTQIHDQSPATSSAWAIAEVNGLESGYELVS